uniref:FYVE-type zinc finger domain-containing protein n=1 Tax=Parastrongyloides trichosuri TaxID=131310 RepID=A0A0N4ZFW9_PARTI
MPDAFSESTFSDDILKYTNSELMWIRRQLYRALSLDEENHAFLKKQENFIKDYIMEEYRKKAKKRASLEMSKDSIQQKIKKSASSLSLFSGTSETSIMSSISLLVFSSIVCSSCSEPLGRLINRGENCKKCKILLCKSCSYSFDWHNGKCFYCIECFSETYLNVIKCGLKPKIQNKNISLEGRELRKKLILKIDAELGKRFVERSDEISKFCTAMDRHIKIEEKCNEIRKGPIHPSNLLTVPKPVSLKGRRKSQNDTQEGGPSYFNFGESLRRISYQADTKDNYDMRVATRKILSQHFEELSSSDNDVM